MTNNDMLLISQVLLDAAIDEKSSLPEHQRDTKFSLLADIEDEYGQLRFPACAAFVVFHKFIDEQIEGHTKAA